MEPSPRDQGRAQGRQGRRRRLLPGEFDRSRLSCPCCGKECCQDGLVEKIAAAERYRRGRKLRITSGYRCPRHNAALIIAWEREKKVWDEKNPGVKFTKAKPAQHSLHMDGKAVDVAIATEDEGEVLAVIWRQLGGGGIGTASNFVHLDIGPRREWDY